MTAYFDDLNSCKQGLERLANKLGGAEIELFVHAATVSNVDDPNNLSRVKVLYGEGGDSESDWVPLLNSGSGKVSSQYIGSKVIVASISGNTDNPIVLGLYNTSTENKTLSTSPVALPIIDTSDAANKSDPGAVCNKDNEGRMYLFSNNVSQDAKICVRRNNRQNDPNANVYEWKNMTKGLVVEKSDDPKTVNDSSVVAEEKPLPNCSQELEGELIQFTEDRDFRQVPMVCKKDENKDWAWVPTGVVPTYFKSILPKCSEKIHGMQALIDDGNNSELGICIRMDKEMKWVKYGTRQVIKFADQPAPIKKSEFLAGATDNAALAIQAASAVSSPFSDSNLLNTVMKVGGGLAAGLSGSGVEGFKSFVPQGALGGNNAILDIAQNMGAAVLSGQGIGISDLTSVLSSGNISDAGNLIAKLGPLAEKLLREGSLDSAQIFSAIGTDALGAGISGLSFPDAGQLTSLMAGGGLGTLDAAVQYGLNAVSGPAGDVFKEIVGGIDLGNAPSALANLLEAGATGGLSDAVGNIANGFNLDSLNPAGLIDQISGGGLGDVAQAFQSFSNFGSLNSIVPGLPTSASSLMGLAGLSSPLSLAFPGAGLGISAVTSLLGGSNPLSSILGGGGAFGALGGLFGGGGGGPQCPCDPKCRKTKHAVDSDGQRLLDPAGNLTLDNSNVYGSDILNNNKGCLAEGLGLDFTGIGASLIPSNILDLTSLIKSIPRVGEMSSMFENAVKGGAEQADLNIEMVYTLEAIEKTFKMADNNTSIMELIQRLNLLGTSDFMNNLIADKDGGLLGKMSTDDIEQSAAIKDLYRMINEVNRAKWGSDANVAPTPAIIASIANIGEIPAYFSKSKARSLINLIKNIIEALSVLGSLDPELAAPFTDLETTNIESKVLNDSMSAKMAFSQPTEDSLNSNFKDYNKFINSNRQGSNFGINVNFLTPNQLDSGDFDTLLNQVQNEQKRAAEGKGDCS
tara:strand:+ start:273 stop:3179 length:2907 start_codon:yes stop_codon:yes gene_type:complete